MAAQQRPATAGAAAPQPGHPRPQQQQQQSQQQQQQPLPRPQQSQQQQPPPPPAGAVPAPTTVGGALALLGLAPGASRDDVRRAYKRLALRAHPDKTRDAEANARFAALAAAHALLTGGGGRAASPASAASATWPAFEASYGSGALFSDALVDEALRSGAAPGEVAALADLARAAAAGQLAAALAAVPPAPEDEALWRRLHAALGRRRELAARAAAAPCAAGPGGGGAVGLGDLLADLLLRPAGQMSVELSEELSEEGGEEEAQKERTHSGGGGSLAGAQLERQLVPAAARQGSEGGSSSRRARRRHGRMAQLRGRLFAALGACALAAVALAGCSLHSQTAAQLGALRAENDSLRSLLIARHAAASAEPGGAEPGGGAAASAAGTAASAAGTAPSAAGTAPSACGAVAATNATAAVPTNASAGAQEQHQPGTLCLDLVELLGLRAWSGGVTWAPQRCFTCLREVFPHAPEVQLAALRARLERDLVAAAAAARGVAPGDLDPAKPWWAALRGRPASPSRSVVGDAGYAAWGPALMAVLARYLVALDTRGPAVPCPGMPAELRLELADLPLPGCPGRDGARDGAALLAATGLMAEAHAPIASIAAAVVGGPGLCTTSTAGWGGAASYGAFLAARARDPAWHAAGTGSTDEGAVLMLAEVLYQMREVFLRQRWLGVSAMQAPADLMAIADVIVAVKPDVIIETGTANGGSALVWASVLELAGLRGSRVVTIDMQPPSSAEAFGADEGPHRQPQPPPGASAWVLASPVERAQARAVDHPLWRRFVTFVQGDSTDPHVRAAVVRALHDAQLALARGGAAAVPLPSAEPAAAPAGAVAAPGRPAEQHGAAPAGVQAARLLRSTAARPARSRVPQRRLAGEGEGQGEGAGRALRVLVILDSLHSATHVAAELEAYCTLVTPGSLCICQDTRLSRWSGEPDPGPVAAVKAWLARHPEFRVDTLAEPPLFSSNAGGYLLRTH
ncbi:djlA [Scenedesmus sp. PABB004]|nr:djlA [Scenedesmus sp. PABB004]